MTRSTGATSPIATRRSPPDMALRRRVGRSSACNWWSSATPAPMDRIVSIDLLDRGFARCEDFDLAAYAAQSFGVFQEEPIDVVLRFEPEAADDAARWMFHPTQRFEREPGGSLAVRFRSGGLQEMCWHLFTWGTTVRVIEPQELA